MVPPLMASVAEVPAPIKMLSSILMGRVKEGERGRREGGRGEGGREGGREEMVKRGTYEDAAQHPTKET